MTTSPTAQQIVHVLLIEHKHGSITNVYATGQAAYDALHEYVAENWYDDDGPIPADQDAAIEAYFEDNGDEFYTLNDVSVDGIPAPTPGEIPAAVHEWVETTLAGDGVRAIRAIAEHWEVAVAYQDRRSLEAGHTRPFTEAEWNRIKDNLDDYDEWLDQSGAGPSIDAWRDQLIERSNVTGECNECGKPMFLTPTEVAHHYDGDRIPPADPLPIDYAADDDHTPHSGYVYI